MTEAHTSDRRTRIGMAVPVAAVHLLLFILLIRGIGFDVARATGEAMKVFDISQAVPPPKREPPKPRPAPTPPKEAPAPLSLRNPQEAPKAVLPIPAAATASDIGIVAQPGIGAGAGREGAGTGGGGKGGDDGAATHARLIRREFRRSDYPREARAAGAEGTVRMRIEVAANGRVSGCSVTSSSGNAALDATTCRLAQKRFRYEPARDAQGRPVPDVVFDGQRWWIEPR